jgi:Sigma 54 modulation/S30EA ribosomal protein C terminus
MATEAVSRSPASGVVHLDAGGAVGPAERDLAVSMIGAVLTRHAIGDGAARLRLSGGARCGGPGLAQVNLRVCGAPARVQVPGPTVAQAVTAAAHRLDRQIHRLTSTWEAWPWPDPQRRPLGVAGGERIAREKRVRLRTGTVCQATATMDAMDYDFHLFVDGGTGEDAIVYRSGPTGVRLSRQRSMHPPRVPAGQPVTINPRKVPELTRAEAARQLCAGWLPLLFFTDPASGRGNVLYRRYDATLGLVTPDAQRREAA